MLASIRVNSTNVNRIILVCSNTQANDSLALADVKCGALNDDHW